MRHPKILYRTMFNTKGPSSYGKGIASNLVTEEERQKYNSGGRVRAAYGLPYQIKDGNRIYNKYYDELNRAQDLTGYHPWKVKEWEDITGEEELPGIGELQFADYYDRDDYDPYKVGTASRRPGTIGAPQRDIVARGVIAPERKGSFEDLSMQEVLKEQAAEKGDVWIDESKRFDIQPTTDEELIKRKSIIEGASSAVPIEEETTESTIGNLGDPQMNLGVDTSDPMPLPPKAEDTETLDVASIIDKYYDKKGSLGEAQFGLAGQVLKAAFQPKSKAMGTVGDAIGQFGKDAMADKKAFNKLAATGEIQRELYRMSRSEEGKQDRETKAYDAKLKAWLKKNDVSEEEIGDIEKYNNSLFRWNQKNEDLTGYQHQNLVGGFDEKFATDSIVMEQITTGAGDTKTIGFSPSDLNKYNEAEEGTAIFIGGKIYIKNSSIKGVAGKPDGMEEVNYTSLKVLKKKKPKKTFKRFE